LALELEKNRFMEIEDINKNILKKMWDFYIDKKVFVKGK